MAPPTKKSHHQSRQTKIYLLAYNFNNAVLWGVIFLRTIFHAATGGFASVQSSMSDLVPFTQTLALLEIAHSAFGLVRAPLFTTAIQVFSRIFIIWFVVYPFPQVALHPAYTSMLLAWSITEVIRYAYFTVNVIGFNIPELTWLRYSTFFVLYPPGILSEAFLAYSAAVGPAESLHAYYPYFLWAVLVIYVPFSPVMYTHMMAQRRKIMKDWDTKYANKEL